MPLVPIPSWGGVREMGSASARSRASPTARRPVANPSFPLRNKYVIKGRAVGDWVL